MVEPGTEGTTSFIRDGNGRVTRMTAPPPAGVSCSTLVRGCRALTFTYATSTTATGTDEGGWGAYAGLVTQISYTAWDPTASAMTTTSVASYLYDSTGHLRASWDPRISPALKTRYGYDGTGRIATVTPPGLAGWTIGYDTAGRVVSVSRPDPVHGTAAQTVVYGVPLTGAAAPIAMSAAQTATWGQAVDLPAYAAAVFPASRVPPAGGDGRYAPGAGDWAHADLAYLDVNGREVNTASFGAGAWLVDATRYDPFGNEVWSLTADNRAQALVPRFWTASYVRAQTDSAVRADLLATISTYSADGADLLTTAGPTHDATLSWEAVSSMRTETNYTYDEGKPDATTYHLVTTTVTRARPVDGKATTGPDTRTTRTGYDPIDGASATGPTSGWVLRQPTTQTIVMPGGTDIVTKTRYDTAGRVVEARQPASTGADAGTTVSTYYTAAANPTWPQCGGHAEWDGLVCRTGPAAQPPGVPIPVTETVYGNVWAQPTAVSETSGAATRTTATSYTSDGTTADPNGARVRTVAVTTSGVTTTAVPPVTIDYDPATGLPVALSTPDGASLTTAYDTLGRVVSYTDADANTATTTYTIDGQVATAGDGKGTVTYTYDGTDPLGRQEHRGLVTRMDAGMGAAPSVFTGAYDESGNIATQIYPNGMKARYFYDNLGDAHHVEYVEPGGDWMFQFWADPNPFGQTVYASSVASDQENTYDAAGRLTRVEDTYWGYDALSLTCHTRVYTYSVNSNRTTLSDYPDVGDGYGTCTTSTTPVTRGHGYDPADRITDTGYSYDPLGRTLTIPAADTAGGAAATIGYHANDLPRSLTQGGITQTFTLDPAGRYRTATRDTGPKAGTIINHYDSTSDNPAWVAEPDGSWTRNLAGLTGDLAAIQNSDGTVDLQITNLHGDVVATVADDPAAVGVNAYFEQTEYGIPRADNTTNPDRYGWLGARQRSTDTQAGLILMGVRLYNPATGRFLSVDPIPGGTPNRYVYVIDPIGQADLSGCSSEAGTSRGGRCNISSRYAYTVKKWWRYSNWVRGWRNSNPWMRAVSILVFLRISLDVVRVTDVKYQRRWRITQMRRCVRGYWRYFNVWFYPQWRFRIRFVYGWGWGAFWRTTWWA